MRSAKIMQGITARVMYCKTGLTRFIGHLDSTRVLRRAVGKAGIEGVYSQGFSPRLRLSFSPPLPLGFTSDCEFFDIKLAGRCRPDTIKRRLRASLPEGFVVKEVQLLEGDHVSPAAAFWAAEYEIEVPHDCPVNRENPAPAELSRGDALSAVESDVSGSPEGKLASHVLRASWTEKDNGAALLTVVLRQDSGGKGGVRRSICELLGIPREVLEKCRVHKKRVYSI
ncbi:DUF2344 domain-containing protein [bacterium]|nr:DUF2344 domain-containing protein [bacterium]